MASTLLVKDIMWRIAVLLQDSAPQFQRWPERELVHWLNDAQIAITKYLPMACSRVDAIKLATGTRQSLESIAAVDCLPGDGSSPAVAIRGKQFLSPRRNMGSNGTTPGRAIRMVERDTLDSQDQDWHTRTGSIVSSCVFDPVTPKYFYVTPSVVGTVWIEIAYTAAPTLVPNSAAPGSEAYLNSGGSTAVLGIDDEYADDLVDFVVARANMKDTKYAESAKAVFHTNRFLSSLNAKMTAVNGANPNLTMLPGVTT